MENGQSTKTGNELEPRADTLEDSTKLPHLENMEARASGTSLPPATSATTPKDSSKIWESAALEVLRSKAGLVAGALSDFQTAGGLVAVERFEYEASGSKFSATKLYLVAENLNIVVEETTDGLIFDIQPLGEVKVKVKSE